MIPRTYNTVTEAISKLRTKGYTIDFNVVNEEDCIVCSQRQIVMSADDFEIDAYYRFDGGSDPGDEMILYAISSTKFNAKGVLLSAYGVNADTTSAKLISKLHV
jgi:site-specific DNA-cytosine methylase